MSTARSISKTALAFRPILFAIALFFGPSNVGETNASDGMMPAINIAEPGSLLEITAIDAEPAPGLGVPFRLTIEIVSTSDQENALIAIDAEPPVRILSESRQVETSLRANVPERQAFRLEVQEPGQWAVIVSAAYVLPDSDPVMVSETVGLSIGPEGGEMVRAHEITWAQSEARHPAEQVAEPFELQDFGLMAIPEPGPGEIQIEGRLFYESRMYDGDYNGNSIRDSGDLIENGVRVLPQVIVELWNRQPLGDELLDNTRADATGFYRFKPVENRSDLGLYLLVYASDYERAGVIDEAGFLFQQEAEYTGSMDDGTHSFNYTIPLSPLGALFRPEQAFYIYDKLANDAYGFVQGQIDWDDHRYLTVHWPKSCILGIGGACFRGDIYLQIADGETPDVILHEYGHFVLSRYIGGSDVILACLEQGFTHFFWTESDPVCAWSEGWADFFEMAVQDDPDYAGADHEHVDGHLRDDVTRVGGDPEAFEDVVTAVLWDLYDGGAGEDFDQMADGWDGPADNGIWTFTSEALPPSNTHVSTIEQFWLTWKHNRPDGACYASAIFQHHLLAYPPLVYTLATSVNPAGRGTVSASPAPNCPGDTYEDGTSVALTASPVAGYVFAHWSGDATGTTNPVSVVMDSDKSITAHFAVPTPTPTPTRTPTPGPSPTPTRTPTRTPTPPPTFPRMPICGDQDGSETPLVFKCRDLQWAGDVQLYQVPGSGSVELTFDFVYREAAYNNELVFFLVDDALGRIGGIAPGEPGYLAAAFARAQVIFPSGSNAFTPDVSVQLEGGRFIVVLIVQNSRLSTLLTNNPNNELNKLPLAFFSFNALNPDGVDHFIGYENPALDISHFGFEDLRGGGDRDFDDIVYNVVPRLQPLSARVHLSPLSAEKTVGETHTLSAEVLDKQGNSVSGEPVTFEVEGANPTVGSAITNASGIATFSYVGSEVGNDTVVAHTSEAVSNTAIVLWRSSCPIRVFWGGSSAARGPGTMGEAMVLIRRLQQTVDVVRLLERVRDEVLTTTPQGQRYIELFNLHASEITTLMLADEALRDQGVATVEAFVPALQAFVDGEGGQVFVRSDQVDNVIAFLQALSGVASPELRQDIANELARRPLEPIAAMTMDQAWDYLNNLPPVAEAGGPYETDEGQSALLDASGSTDPDNNIVLYEWDLDSDGEFDDATGVTATVGFGDNGTFIVGLNITDELGKSSSDTAQVIVSNLLPQVALDTSVAIPFVGGDAFMGRAGIAQSHSATATDPGSDDLTFAWDFGSTTTYFNNGVDADPFPSPGGAFPFTAVDTAGATFDSPGKYDLDLTVYDDDGGSSSVAFTKLVTGGEACTLSQGFWKHQFSGQGNQQANNDTLEAYLAIVNHASRLFSEAVPLNILSEASTVIDAKGSGMRPKAQAQLLAAWLNFAHGSVGWDEPVDTDRDGIGDMAFGEVVAQAEAILLNPSASQQELVRAKDLAEAVNLLDQGTEGCE